METSPVSFHVCLDGTYTPLVILYSGLMLHLQRLFVFGMPAEMQVEQQQQQQQQQQHSFVPCCKLRIHAAHHVASQLHTLPFILAECAQCGSGRRGPTAVKGVGLSC